MPRKPWEIPIEYTDSRWDTNPTESDQEERSERDIEELLHRPTRTEEAGQLKVSTTDNRPINYGHGPHNVDLDIDDNDDGVPSDYHPRPETKELFGLIDDEDLLDADLDDAEFDDSY
jgi:hypothetical protein